MLMVMLSNVSPSWACTKTKILATYQHIKFPKEIFICIFLMVVWIVWTWLNISKYICIFIYLYIFFFSHTYIWHGSSGCQSPNPRQLSSVELSPRLRQKSLLMLNRPGVAGAILQTPPWLIHSLFKSVILCGNIFNTLSFPSRKS